MRGLELKKYFLNELSNVYDERESENIFFLIVDAKLNLNRIDWNMDHAQSENQELEQFIKDHIGELQEGKPVQQILASSFFYDLDFEIDSHVLIPRPETEELVDWILKNTDSSASINLLDIGTGSGCISIVLAKNLSKSNVEAWDISSKALEVARKNARKYDLKNIDFEAVDALQIPDDKNVKDSWDVIVSNPPYILVDEKNLLNKNVLDYEPHEALFVTNNDPLQFYKAIANYGLNCLKSGGYLYFECHEDYARDVKALLESFAYIDVILKKDLQGKLRMCRAQKEI